MTFLLIEGKKCVPSISQLTSKRNENEKQIFSWPRSQVLIRLAMNEHTSFYSTYIQLELSFNSIHLHCRVEQNFLQICNAFQTLLD